MISAQVYSLLCSIYSHSLWSTDHLATISTLVIYVLSTSSCPQPWREGIQAQGTLKCTKSISTYRVGSWTHGRRHSMRQRLHPPPLLPATLHLRHSPCFLLEPLSSEQQRFLLPSPNTILVQLLYDCLSWSMSNNMLYSKQCFVHTACSQVHSIKSKSVVLSPYVHLVPIPHSSSLNTCSFSVLTHYCVYALPHTPDGWSLSMVSWQRKSLWISCTSLESNSNWMVALDVGSHIFDWGSCG